MSHSASMTGGQIEIHVQTTSEESPLYQTAQENPDHQLMYKAASEGNWAEAEQLLEHDTTNLGSKKITAQGDRALHLAVLGKHTEFVGKLIQKVGSEESVLRDGNGYTACCYAAMAGNLELVRIMVKAKQLMVNATNSHGTTPLALAIYYGHKEVVSYLLSVDNNFQGLAKEQLFKILLDAILRRMFDVALIIFKKHEGIARMKDVHGRTALHVFATVNMSSEDYRVGKADYEKLATKLWLDIQDSGTSDGVLELMKNPPILHYAAKVGNLYIVKMITSDFPDLLSHTDEDTHSMFHIAVIHRRWNMLELVNVKNFGALSIDKDGNNLLHSAAKSRYHREVDSVSGADIELDRAYNWFKAVEAVVPPIYRNMQNNNKDIPIELFWKQCAPLAGKILTYTKQAAESGRLISTIVLTLVFAVAISPPGGFNRETGIPVLSKHGWFKISVSSNSLALIFSCLSIILLSSIIFSEAEAEAEAEAYHSQYLLRRLRFSMYFLLISVFCVISSFLSAYMLFSSIRYQGIILYITFGFLLIYLGQKVGRKLQRKVRARARLPSLRDQVYGLYLVLCS